MSNSRKYNRDKRLINENEILKNKIKTLEIENKRLTAECEYLYESFAEIKELEDLYNLEIYKLKELKKKYNKEVKAYIALKQDYKKAMDKFLDSLG